MLYIVHTKFPRISADGLRTLQKFLELQYKEIGWLFQKQKIKGSLWNLCAVYAGLEDFLMQNCNYFGRCG